MNVQPCLPKDIIELNRDKEYTLISTSLLESVLTDVRLNAQTTKLWQILFNYSRFTPNFEVKISYGYLAKKLGKSERTICRYVDLLQEAGYLIVKHNFDKNGGQRPSTLYVRVPKNTIEHTKKKKDRFNKNSPNIDETLIENPANAIEQQFAPNDSNVLCETMEDNDFIQGADQYSPKAKINVLDVHEGKANDLLNLNAQDINVVGGADINVLHKDSIKEDLNNNNIVVSLNDEILEIKNEIKMLEQQWIEGNKKQLEIKDYSLLYDKIKENGQIEGMLQFAKSRLNFKEKQALSSKKQNFFLENINNNPKYILKKEGKRILPIFTFKRLVKSLKSYGYQQEELNKLINEIVFEIRFGSLIKCSKTKEPLSLDNAINIGLKLVREKRWSSPTQLLVATKETI